MTGIHTFLRVRSWLRINAGGVPNTCKLSERVIASSERVSNTLGIYPLDWNTLEKSRLMPDTFR